jgi:uncharacterized protein (TIGR00297 family)
MDFGLRLFTGLVGGACVGFAAYRARSLTAEGAVAAGLMGTAAVVAGWSWAALLILYFVSSTLWSRAGRRVKLERTAGMVEKPGPRDAQQVMANGIVFLVAAVAAGFGLGPRAIWMAIAAGSLAASAADTWATEIGTLVGQTPRSIRDGRRLTVGQSGGITLAGTIGAVAGAGFVAAVIVVAGWPGGLWLPVAVGGVGGALADSIIGATLQQRRWCDACEKPTEMLIHQCGATSRHVGGATFVENDAVNLMATVVGAGLAVGLYAVAS